MRVVVLVPRRPDGGTRDRLWAFCREQWHAGGFTLFEGHHDDGGPFSRAAAINLAARDAGTWDVAVIADADVILDGGAGQAFRAAVLAKQTGRLVYAHDHLTMCDVHATELVLAGHHPSEAARGLERHPNTWSQCLAVPCCLWEDVGGFDERFAGWGWEDFAFMSSCWALGGAPSRITGDVYHLWHPRSRAENEEGPHHHENHVLGERYLAAKQDRRAMLALIAERP